MNKHEEYQEALDFYWKVYDEHHLGMLARHYIDILQELVDKATPKKRVYVDTTPSISSHFICPVCRTKVSPISLYCDTCGQRLE